MRPAKDVALYFLHRVDRDEGDTISQLRLQKLVYYTQVWSLVLRNQPFFEDEIQAWIHGPVVPGVWSAYHQYGKRDIPLPDEPAPPFDPVEARLLDYVWQRYGELSAGQLRNLTHREQPWLAARGNLADRERSQQPIALEAMRQFHLTESPWGRLQTAERPYLTALVEEVLQRPAEFPLTTGSKLAEVVQMVLDEWERLHADYDATMAAAVAEAIDHSDPALAMTADELAHWIATL
jgi:uncharacterized phage-associated protein